MAIGSCAAVRTTDRRIAADPGFSHWLSIASMRARPRRRSGTAAAEPWESLHVEALAWFDHWLKDRDTGILDGPAIRYVLPEAEGWRTATTWPPASTTHRELALGADGVLGVHEGEPGARSYLTLGAGLGQTQARTTGPGASLTWTSDPLDTDLDMVGDIELEL